LTSHATRPTIHPMTLRRLRPAFRAAFSILALFALLPPVGFGFCATDDGHFELRFFESVSVECCTATPARGAGECDPPQCASCDDVAMALQAAIPIDHPDVAPPDRSCGLSFLDSPEFETESRFNVARPAGRRHRGTTPALETTLLRP